MKNYLAETLFIDHSSTDIKKMSDTLCSSNCSDKENAISLYLYVRDSIKYDPYSLVLNKGCFTASQILKAGKGYCVSKAILFTALLRSINMPARLGFADVTNHIASKKLLERMGTNIFYYHGYVEVFLNNRWVKATPAFDRDLCESVGISVLEFDGENDSMFQKFNDAGNEYMEYLNDHGHFSDVPYDLLVEKYTCYYPALVELSNNACLDDLHTEVELEKKC